MPDSSLTSFDSQLAGGGFFRVPDRDGNMVEIPFQFPPRIVSETKSSNWTTDNQAGFEPIKYYMGSGARVINLEAEYFATDDQDGDFSPSGIAASMRSVKEYFYAANVWEGFSKQYPIVELAAYQIIPFADKNKGSAAQFRLMDANITYGPEFVADPSEGISGGEDGVAISKFAYPIYTKMALSLELVTRATFDENAETILSEVEPLQIMKDDWF